MCINISLNQHRAPSLFLSSVPGERWQPMMGPLLPRAYVSKLLLFPRCRRPRKGSPNWAKWSHGMSWAVGKRKAAAQTATMKMGVKHREVVRAQTVSHKQTVHAQFYSVFFPTLWWTKCPQKPQVSVLAFQHGRQRVILSVANNSINSH